MPQCEVKMERVQAYLDGLTEKEREKAFWSIRRLEDYGKGLPSVSQGQWAKIIKDSRYHPELLELRATMGRSVIRIAYYIDTAGVAHLLWGGDKRKLGEKRFYKRLIREADRAIDSITQQLE